VILTRALADASVAQNVRQLQLTGAGRDLAADLGQP
jgi:hypothetical protein